jgi:hypothetical protein
MGAVRQVFDGGSAVLPGSAINLPLGAGRDRWRGGEVDLEVAGKERRAQEAE